MITSTKVFVIHGALGMKLAILGGSYHRQLLAGLNSSLKSNRI